MRKIAGSPKGAHALWRSASLSLLHCGLSMLSGCGSVKLEAGADPVSGSAGASAARASGAAISGASGSLVMSGSAGVSGGTASIHSKPAATGGSPASGPVTPSRGVAGMTPSAAGAGGMAPPTSGSAAGTSAAGVGGEIAAAAAGTGGAAGATPEVCTKDEVKASEVVFIGESFIAQTGDIPRMTSELARKAGTIGANESYRSFAMSGTQLTTGDIPNQYTRAQMASPVKVVLMDGGGNDLLFGNRCMGSFDAPCKEVVDVVAEMFTDFKSGGVTDVVYFFYPDPMGIGANIKDGMDILRPEMKKLCDGATEVRCVWVDQRDSWEGNYDQFTSDGIHPTAAGSMASAQQIWDAMVVSCVAQ